MKTTYTCPYCGVDHNTPASLAHCILACEEKKQLEEQMKREEELASTKEAREQEINDAYKHYQRLVNEFIKDYGRYDVTRHYEARIDNDNDAMDALLFSSKPWRMFF